MFKIKFTLLILFITVITAKAQYKGLGGWNIITVNLPGSLKHHWGGYVELQDRNYGVTTQFYYYEVKAGVSYNFDNNSSMLLGTGRYTTYGYDEFDEGPQVTETRLWEQFNFTQYLSRIKFDHRYRVEQRWLNTGYRNRFRYRLTATVPINYPKMQKGAAFVSGFAEAFLTNKEPHFERSRFAASLGYQFTKAFNFQAGIINQYNYALSSDNNKNYLILTATYNIQRN
ncbi:DUF2490 domain-containing protein [Mucilaginibacter sp. Bleaf8]|uniref:DUF2490 domain-containing protein n=1 Tax=Mucilaginibacter sp. Bleaf8 TaxID=2834430 RepID=UPI001BCD861C|nr:DUF2490 domain-containing protein [Mucilaginibacter sp. Bleaf8]MBS7563991.1 DUF2490 domain-containing protein [Mucilaginibacter sp. Bleaf8]